MINLTKNMKSRLKIDIGDRAKVILNGEVKELEVVDLFPGDKKSDGKFSFSLFVQDILGRGYLERIQIKLPDGQIIECRPFHSML